MMQNSEPKPKNVEQKELKHDYKIMENGDVKVTQTQTLEITWASREFTSLLRGNEKSLEQTKKAYSEEQILKMKKQEKDITKEIEKLKPIVEESERLAKIAYTKQIHDGLVHQLKAAIADKETKEQWWIQIWNRVKDEKKTAAIKDLSEDEKKGMTKIMAKLKRKGIQ